MANLTRLIGNTNRDHELERKLLWDLPHGSQTPNLFMNLMRFHSMKGNFCRKYLLSYWQCWKLTFCFNKVPCYKKVGLVAHKLYYGAREWWFEFLDFRNHIGMSSIPSLQDLRQSLILEFIQDDYEEIWYRIDK